LLASPWEVVLDFDPVLAGYVASPVAVPDRTVTLGSLPSLNGVTAAVEADGIGFIAYAAFCPSYASRYDGVFPIDTELVHPT
jgi:hypothetical protein